MTGNYDPLLHNFFRNLLKADPLINKMHYLDKSHSITAYSYLLKKLTLKLEIIDQSIALTF
jgi:hypothetical protein